jgi:hypothetical protein
MSTKIVVKNNSPGWPAMVKKAPAEKNKVDGKMSEQIQRMKGSFSAPVLRMEQHHTSATITAGAVPVIPVNSMPILRMEQHHYPTPATTVPINPVNSSSMWLKNRYLPKSNTSVEIKNLPTFAPKIVRQCHNCQILYTNYHMCETEGSFAPKENSS